MDEQRFLSTMEAVWRECTRPEAQTILLDRHTGAMFVRVSDEVRRLRQVPTPAGLRGLFPSLKQRT
jgi:hypothetical protein